MQFHHPTKRIPHSQGFIFTQLHIYSSIARNHKSEFLTKKRYPQLIDYKATQPLSIIERDVTTQVLACNFTKSGLKVKTHFQIPDFN